MEPLEPADFLDVRWGCCLDTQFYQKQNYGEQISRDPPINLAEDHEIVGNQRILRTRWGLDPF